MITQKCPECHAAFEPRRSTQLYCSPKCSGRHRERNRRDKRRATTRTTTQTLVAVERAKGNARLLKAERDHGQTLSSQTHAITTLFHDEILARDRIIDDQNIQLQLLAAKYLDQSGQLAEAKAECVELKLEVSRILKDRRADLQDLMQIAVRMLQLTTHLGIPLDHPTAELFRRRGWNTKIPAGSK